MQLPLCARVLVQHMPHPRSAIATGGRFPASLVEEHAKKLAGPTEEGHGLPSCTDLLATMEGEKRPMLQGGLDHSTRSSKHHQGESGSMGQGGRYQPKAYSFGG